MNAITNVSDAARQIVSLEGIFSPESKYVTIPREEYTRLLTASIQRAEIKRAYYRTRFESEFGNIVALILGLKKES